MVEAKWIPRAAASVYFLMILLQVPFFRVPCRTGVCSTPLHVMAGQMGTTDMVPFSVIKGLLYPGALLHHTYKRDSLASVWGNLSEEYNLTAPEPASSAYKFRLEVIAGSYFAVGGALISLIKSGRTGMFGLLLIIWGLLKDGVFQRPEQIADDPANGVHADVMLFVALALALLSVRYDMKKVQRLGAPIARPLRSSTKEKLKRR